MSIALDPENVNNVYLATGQTLGVNDPSGAIIYSHDNGVTWNTVPLTIKLGGAVGGDSFGERLAVDPNNSSIIFLGTSQNGLYESVNAGVSWTQVAGFSTAAGASSGTTFVTFDKRSGSPGSASTTFYVGVNTISGPNIFVTTNGGMSFSAVTGQPTGLEPTHAAFSATGNLFVTYAGAGSSVGNVEVYSTSGGTWSVPAVTGLASGGLNSVSIDPENANDITRNAPL